MSDNEQGKAVVERAKPRPKWVSIGRHEVLSSGRWHHGMMAEWILLHGIERWVTLAELAKKAYGSKSIRDKHHIRRVLSQWFSHILINHRRLLVVEYGGEHGAATQVKIFDPKSATERQYIGKKLEKMKSKKTLTSEQFELAESVMSTVYSN